MYCVQKLQHVVLNDQRLKVDQETCIEETFSPLLESMKTVPKYRAEIPELQLRFPVSWN
jgi:hypothetical protein